MRYTMKRVFALALALMLAFPALVVSEDVDLMAIAGKYEDGEGSLAFGGPDAADGELPLVDLLGAAAESPTEAPRVARHAQGSERGY